MKQQSVFQKVRRIAGKERQRLTLLAFLRKTRAQIAENLEREKQTKDLRP